MVEINNIEEVIFCAKDIYIFIITPHL